MTNDATRHRVDFLFLPHFFRKLADGSSLVGFKGSRFHTHVFQDGDVLVGLLTENSKGGLKEHSTRIEIKLTEVNDILAKMSPTRLKLPPETEAVFIDWPLKEIMRRVILGLCPPDISRFFDELSDMNREPPELHELFYKLADWELREPGTLSRWSLEDAREKYPLNTPCCVLVGNVPLFGTLQEDGAIVYPKGFPPEYLKLLGEILRMDELLSAPVKNGNEEVRLGEEFMNELKSLYDDVVGETSPNRSHSGTP